MSESGGVWGSDSALWGEEPPRTSSSICVYCRRTLRRAPRFHENVGEWVHDLTGDIACRTTATPFPEGYVMSFHPSDRYREQHGVRYTRFGRTTESVMPSRDAAVQEILSPTSRDRSDHRLVRREITDWIEEKTT